MERDIYSRLKIELPVFLAISLMIAALLFVQNPKTLDIQTYGFAKEIIDGELGGVHSIIVSAIYNMLDPIIGGDHKGMDLVNIFLVVPLVFSILSSLFAYSALRLWGFDKFSSIGSSILLMLSPAVFMAFLPGLLIPQMSAILFALMGLAGLAEIARERGAIMPLAAIVSLVGFVLAVLIHPWMVLLPLSILIGQIAMHHENISELFSKKKSNPVILAVLLVPIIAFGVSGDFEFTFSISQMLNGIFDIKYLIGLAALSFPALMFRETYPKAVYFSTITIAALIFSSISASASAIALLFSAAYGINILTKFNNNPQWMKAVLLVTVVGLSTFSYVSSNQDLMSIFAVTLILTIVFVSLLYLYGFDATIVKNSILIALISSAMFTSIYLKDLDADDRAYRFEPLDKTMQEAIVKTTGLDGERVFAYADIKSVEFLSGKNLVYNESQWSDYLSAKNLEDGEFESGDLLILTKDDFDTLKMQMQEKDERWTLVNLYLLGVAQDDSGRNWAVYLSRDGVRIHVGVNEAGKLTSERPRVFSADGRRFVNYLVQGDVDLLYQNSTIMDQGNMLIWYNEEYDSNILNLFRGQTDGFATEEYRDEDILIMKVD